MAQGPKGCHLLNTEDVDEYCHFFFARLCHQIKLIRLFWPLHGASVNNTIPAPKTQRRIMAVEQWKSCCCCVWHFPWFHVIVSRQSHPEHFLKSFSYSFFHCLSVFSQPFYHCWRLVKPRLIKRPATGLDVWPRDPTVTVPFHAMQIFSVEINK